MSLCMKVISVICIAADMMGQQTETLLAGSLAKALCCILLMMDVLEAFVCFFKAVSRYANYASTQSHYQCIL